VTYTLALWGAVTGTLSTAVLLANLVLDRSRLVVRSHLVMDGWKHKLEIRVIARGRRPMTVLEVGLAVEGREEGRWRKRIVPQMTRYPSQKTPTTLGPWGVLQEVIDLEDAKYVFQMTPEEWERRSVLPGQTYAIDGRNRIAWGGRSPRPARWWRRRASTLPTRDLG